MAETITVHGDEWRLADLEEAVDWCRGRLWTQREWKCRPALVHRKGGAVSLYTGQKYDPEKIDLVEDAWTHDHCTICYFALHESDDRQERFGWVSGYDWVCGECYELFLKNKAEPAGAQDGESAGAPSPPVT
jgi:hypothetical protein